MNMLNNRSAESFRTEDDSLNDPRLIPKEAYFGIDTRRALENFPEITGYRLHPEMIKALAIVKKSAALANKDKLIEKLRDKNGLGEHAEAAYNFILDTCDAIIGEIGKVGNYHEHFVVDPIQGGAGTSINMNANEVIANIVLEKLGYAKGTYDIISPYDDINMSQSTNDVIPTAARICIRVLLNGLLNVMEQLAVIFADKAKEFDKYVKIGRTHLQDAVPIRLGQEFDAYYRVLKRDIERIKKTGEYLYEVNMGATAVGTALNSPAGYVESVVGHLKTVASASTGCDDFNAIKSCESLIDGTQNTDCFTEVSAALKICMVNMSKISNDIRLMASGPRCGFSEITLKELQHGSSIMPGKVNPVIPELINQVAFKVIGNDSTVFLASEAGQFELNVMQPVLIFCLIESIGMMSNALKVFGERCIAEITVSEYNKERLNNYLEKSSSLATVLSPKIGHKRSGEIANKATSTGVSVLEICLQDKDLVKELGGEARLKELLNPDKMTRGAEGIKSV
ncbi:MAG: aspartate ammonia-lyase [Clostridiales bacterium]|jgi:aspartate ammonia-lyase|nr:aspartate ammonia-lyase [Clostridiales bacterium]